MTEQTNESYLSLRIPTNEKDEKFISGINSSYEAAKLRSASRDAKASEYHSPVKFSWKDFWKTMIYENLPPVIFSPIAALLLEKSLSRAWHVSQNRMLIAVSPKHHSIGEIIQMWCIVYPGSWLMNIGLYLALFSESSLILNIDPFHMILAYLLLFMRRLIISTKYGYFRPEDNRRLVGQGWLQPWLFPGLIEDELTVAMDENDICLQGVPLEVDDNTEKKFLEEDSNDLFPAKTSVSSKNEVASGFILFNIIKSVYSSPTMKNFRTILLITVLSLSVTPFLVKFLYGTPLFGMTLNEKIISAATLIGLLNGFQLIMFGLVCSVDYERRYRCSKKLGDLVAFPGLSFNEFKVSISELIPL